MRVGDDERIDAAICWLLNGPDSHSFDEEISLADLRTIVSRALVFADMTNGDDVCTHIETNEKCWAYGGHLDVEGVKVHRVCLKPRFHDDSHVYDAHPAPAESDYHMPQLHPQMERD